MRMLADLGRDLRLGVRTLWRQPGFTALAVSILALGVGASTAMFSLVNALVLNPLPHPEPDRLVRVFRTAGDQQSMSAGPRALRAYRTESHSFQSVAAFHFGSTSLADPGQPAEVVWTLEVTSDFFSVLGGQARLGRVFSHEEDRPDRKNVVVLSSSFWMTRFGGDPAIIGRRLRLGGETVTVVGVMPAAFSDRLRFWGRVSMWRPLGLPAAAYSDRTSHWLGIFARLKPGVTIGAAQAELDGLSARLEREEGTVGGARVVPLHETGGMSQSARGIAWLTVALAIFVLLLACANLAGVQLARLAGRGHEWAIRAALGASRARLLRQTLAEALVLSAAGGLAGLLLARWCVDLVSSRITIGNAIIVTGVPVALDGRVLGFALGLALASALVVGVVPGWVGSRVQVAEALKRGGRGSTERSQPGLGQPLVIGQMVLALVLLAGGGLFVRALDRLVQRGPGWQVEGLFTGQVVLTDARYRSAEARTAFVERLGQRLAALPGVERSALGSWMPLGNFGSGSESFVVEGAAPAPAGRAPTRYATSVAPDFFGTLGVPLREGRVFAAGDGPRALPVVIVNESLARHFWPGQSAIGKRLGSAAGERAWRTIVGVVADIRVAGSLDEPSTRFQTYHPLAQAPPWAVGIALRTARTPEALSEDLRRAVAELDPVLAVHEPAPARQIAERSLANFALTGWILLGFSGLGLVLAGLGVYGLFSRYVVERTQEIGVRVALGARGGQVLWLVLGKGLRLALVGAVVGAGGALAVARLLTGLTAELPAHDPPAVAALALVLIVVALFACWLPARRASRVDPMAALRSE